jgi:hypothetical protein
MEVHYKGWIFRCQCYLRVNPGWRLLDRQGNHVGWLEPIISPIASDLVFILIIVVHYIYTTYHIYI